MIINEETIILYCIFFAILIMFISIRIILNLRNNRINKVISNGSLNRLKSYESELKKINKSYENIVNINNDKTKVINNK